MRYEQGVVARVLEQMTHWPLIGSTELKDLAVAVRRWDPLDGMSCPMCQETPCDSGCPLELVRDVEQVEPFDNHEHQGWCPPVTVQLP